MMIKIQLILLLFFSSTSSFAVNKLYLFKSNRTLSWPWSSKGISRAQFGKVLHTLQNIYERKAKEQGFELLVEGEWGDKTVQAWSAKQDYQAMVYFPGGLAKYKGMTEISFALSVCHELGHIFGGSPLISQTSNDPDYIEAYGDLSVESQADYFASNKCLKLYLNKTRPQIKPVSAYVKYCQNIESSVKAVNQCSVIVKGALTLINLLRAIDQETYQETYPAVQLANKDPKEVEKTLVFYPSHQCRLDTLKAGANCHIDPTIDPSPSDPTKGQCNRVEGHTQGLRPRCWYAD